MLMGTIRGRLLAPLGVLVAMTGTAVAAGPAQATPNGAAVARALEQVRTHPGRTHFGRDQRLAARDAVVDRDGDEHVRFDRTYAGLPVLGGDLVVHSSRDGALRGVSQTLDADLDGLSTKPAVAAGAARRTAEARFDGDRDVTRDDLVVYARDGAPQLAYDVVVTGTLPDGSPSELHVIVDATDGRVLDSFDGIEHATGTGAGFFSGTVPLDTTAVSGGFTLKDPTRGNQYTCDSGNKQTSNCSLFSDADNAWGTGLLSSRQTTAVDATYGTAETWDYYKSVFGRTGIANDGRGAYNRVHYGRGYNNAFWSDSCFCMTYGDGDGTTYNPFDSLDVAGHEMTHGVTARTANLTYSGESGGLNEATSDIFGTMVEAFAANPSDPADFLIGEKLYKSNPTGSRALRYMAQPSRDGASKDCWYSGVGTLDVHYSSGPANHFFYLLSQGSAASPTCDGSTVTGIGNDAAQRIYYRALTVYMTSSTNYAGARAASLAAASDLYGATSAEYAATGAAWSAVGVK